MRRLLVVASVAMLLLAAGAPALGVAGATATQEVDCSFPVTETDASGHEVTVDAEPERVVTLNPSAAQTMWQIGGKEKVVGVSQFGDYLGGAEDLPTVTSGYPSSVNVEQVIELNPDLVLAPNTIANDSVRQLRNAGLTVYRFEMATSIEDVYQKTQLIGRLSGECSGAEETVSQMQTDVQNVEQAVEGQERPTVYYHMTGGFTAGENTFIGKLVETAGGHNIAADVNASRPYFEISSEVVVQQDPDWVVVTAQPGKLGKNPRSYIPEDSVIRNTTAWEENNILVLNSNYLSQPAPKITQPLTRMAKSFQPDAYAEAVQTTTPTTTATTSAATTDATPTTATPTTTSENGSGGVPGFGLGAGLLAMLGAALLARR
jgi:iron complex transport system substrate-binding protein